MNNHPEPGCVHRPRFRLDTGVEVLEEWAASANQSEKNAVYKALFALADQSAFRTYSIVDDWQKLSEFFLMVRKDLVIKVRVHCFDSFGIVYIGPRAGAPGLAAGNLGADLWT